MSAGGSSQSKGSYILLPLKWTNGRDPRNQPCIFWHVYHHTNLHDCDELIIQHNRMTDEMMGGNGGHMPRILRVLSALACMHAGLGALPGAFPDAWPNADRQIFSRSLLKDTRSLEQM